MIFVIDVGNTHLVAGLYQGDELLIDWRVATNKAKTADEYGILFKNLFNDNNFSASDVEKIIISSVVPPLVNVLEDVAIKYFSQRAMIVGPGIKTGINIKTDNPREVGADRIVNAVAANQLYSGPKIIVDFGTATTLCVVSKSGDYLGGVIAPGVGIATDSLIDKAAKLPKVEFDFPDSSIGKNTEQSLKSGILYGFLAQVDGLIKRVKEEFNSEALVIATGGFSSLFYDKSNQIDINNDFLTLEGLRIISGKN